MDKINYYLYHIPGKKIGVTRDLISRVVEQQGYDLDEVEVLEQSTDIDYISDRELELQLSYGYRVDRQKYKDLYINKPKNQNKMYINATEQTSTFPVPVSKLKGRLMDMMGKTWETMHGEFIINMDTIAWIMDNVKTSMYTSERSYIYNKAFAKYFQVEDHATEAERFPFGKDAYQAYLDTLTIRSNGNGSLNYMKTDNRFQLIRDWAGERGLYTKGDKKTQFCKLMEEAGELGRAVLKDDQPEFVDAIGDMVVVLTNMAHLGGTTIEECIDAAYKVISKRTGRMVNGTFVKDEK
jgi:NTP pyrophosphatase (non-canonical NTP hydrolase)